MEDSGSQKQILKSTGIIGGSQVIIILTGIVRTKILAVLLGPVGIGINALYQSVIDIIRNATSFGLYYSAVRDIAVASGTGNETGISIAIKVLSRWIWFTGLLGALISIVFCKAISRATFNNEDHYMGVATLSIAILLLTLSSGQTALLQGIRRIGDMAKVSILSTLTGLFTAVPLYWFLGQRGIVAVIIAGSAVSFSLSWYFVRHIKVVPVQLSWQQTWSKGQAMIKLGLFMILSGFIDVGVSYTIRILVVKKMGESGVGQFSAAWSISTLYLSAVLGAMGTDYYPRLSAIHHDQKQMNRMINEQAEIALLIACPIIIGMLSFIHLIVLIFYSKDFANTAYILNWQLAADFFKILSWPIGFAILAKGKGSAFIFTNLTLVIPYLLISFIGWKFAGIEITGIALLIASVIYMAVVLWFSKMKYNFLWSAKIVKYITIYAPLIILAFLSSRYLDTPYLYITGSIVTGIAAVFSLFYLKNIISVNDILKKLRLSKQS